MREGGGEEEGESWVIAEGEEGEEDRGWTYLSTAPMSQIDTPSPLPSRGRVCPR